MNLNDLHRLEPFVHGLGKAILRELTEAVATAGGVPEIDYQALIEAAYNRDRKWAQGTNGCIAFKCGAEWFRAQSLASAFGHAAPPAPQGKDIRVWGWVWKEKRAEDGCCYIPSYTPEQPFKIGELLALVDPADLHRPLENTRWHTEGHHAHQVSTSQGPHGSGDSSAKSSAPAQAVRSTDAVTSDEKTDTAGLGARSAASLVGNAVQPGTSFLTSPATHDPCSHLRGQILVLANLLRESLQVVKNVEAEGGDEAELLQHIITQGDAALAAVLQEHAMGRVRHG